MGSSSPIGRIKGAQEEDRPCGHCAVDAAMLGVGQDRFHQPKTSRRYHSFTIGVEWRAVLDATHAVGNYCNFFNLLQPWNLDTRNRSRTPLSLCRATVKAFWSRVVESWVLEFRFYIQKVHKTPGITLESSIWNLLSLNIAGKLQVVPNFFISLSRESSASIKNKVTCTLQKILL